MTERAEEAPGSSEGWGKTDAPDTYVAPGVDAQHEWGVQYQGPYEALDDGVARAVRLHSRALANAGLPVLLQSFTNSFRGPDGVVIGSEAMDPKVKAETHDLRHANIRELRVRVKHLVVHDAERLRRSIIPSSVAIERDVERAMAIRESLYKTTIVYSVWERTTLSEQIASILRRVGECWVPCEQNAELLRAHGVELVTVVPHPWFPDNPLAKLTRRKPLATRAFYAIGLWQPRKGFHELVGAFLRAFRPGDRAMLTIKHRATKFPGYPEPKDSVAHWLADDAVVKNGWTMDNLRGRLWLPGGFWSESEILSLHFTSNIYVSSSRGEAFNLGAFDAKVGGNRMVHVPFGGTRDFASPGDEEVGYELEPVPPEYQWEPGAKWASVNVDELAAALRRVEPPARFEQGEAIGRCRADVVGVLMRRRVEAMLGAAR